MELETSAGLCRLPAPAGEATAGDARCALRTGSARPGGFSAAGARDRSLRGRSRAHSGPAPWADSVGGVPPDSLSAVASRSSSVAPVSRAVTVPRPRQPGRNVAPTSQDPQLRARDPPARPALGAARRQAEALKRGATRREEGRRTWARHPAGRGVLQTSLSHNEDVERDQLCEMRAPGGHPGPGDMGAEPVSTRDLAGTSVTAGTDHAVRGACRCGRSGDGDGAVRRRPRRSHRKAPDARHQGGVTGGADAQRG